MRLGIFGGSFDPIHHGHLIAAQLAREALDLDRVLLMVSNRQPLKGSHGAPAADRLRMVELAVEGVEGLEADGRELARGGPSYTVDSLRELAGEFPAAELVLLLGADAARELPRWHEAAAIPGLARIVCFTRGGESPPALTEPLVLPEIAISSTAIRARIDAGRSVRGWVPEPVADYISGLALYRTQGGVG